MEQFVPLFLPLPPYLLTSLPPSPSPKEQLLQLLHRVLRARHSMADHTRVHKNFMVVAAFERFVPKKMHLVEVAFGEVPWEGGEEGGVME